MSPPSPPSGIRAATAFATSKAYEERAQGAAHAKFAASFVSPMPLYLAICGYGQSGREIGEFAFVAIIDAGGVPCSIHRSIAVNASNRSGPGPPPQCRTPGA